MNVRPNLGSHILDTGKTPEEWALVLGERGLKISARNLREKANRLGACYKLGGAMIITPEQIDIILQEGQPCRLKSISGGQRGTQGATLNCKGGGSPSTIGAALAHLQKQAGASGVPQKKTGKSVVTSLAKKRS